MNVLWPVKFRDPVEWLLKVLQCTWTRVGVMEKVIRNVRPVSFVIPSPRKRETITAHQYQLGFWNGRIIIIFLHMKLFFFYFFFNGHLCTWRHLSVCVSEIGTSSTARVQIEPIYEIAVVCNFDGGQSLVVGCGIYRKLDRTDRTITHTYRVVG